MNRFILMTGLLSAAALAQTAPVNSLSFRIPSDLTKDNYTYGAAECGNTVTVAWSNTTTNYFYNLQCAMNPMRIWATSATSCGDAPGTDDMTFDDIPLITVATIKSGTFSVPISSLPAHKAVSDGGVAGCPLPSATTRTQLLCGTISYATSSGFSPCSTTQTARVLPFKFVYDTEPPSPPSVVTINAQDGAASIEFTADSDTVTVQAEVKGPNDLDYYVAGSAIVVNTKTVRATGLLNSQTYEVRIRAIDGAGNVSNPSSTVSVTPILTQGLLGYYASKGGELEGGCATAPGLAPLMLLALALRSRLRRVKGNTSR